MELMPSRVLVTAAFATWFHREIFHGMAAYAHQHTKWQLVCQVNITAAEQRKLRPAGVLSVGSPAHTHRCAHDAGVPVVAINNAMGDPRASVVSVDEEAVGIMAAEHFIDLGLKHLAYVGHGPWPFVRARMESFVKAAEVRGCGPVPHLIGSLYDRRLRPRFEHDLKVMLKQLPRPCGLLAANDELGVVIVGACRDAGLTVPDDIAVLGVDDDQLACELSEVPLSSIVQPLFAVGYEAARMLHQHLENQRAYPARLSLPPLRVATRRSSDLIALEDEDVVAALRLINDHFAEPINVEWVVRQLPVTQRTLYNKFLKLVGRTVLQQIHRVRFQKAKELLAESDLSLDLVAKRSGFANQAWMADSFRRELDITPNRFRRQFRTES
jgi:LacI family transcriptional regulator